MPAGLATTQQPHRVLAVQTSHCQELVQDPASLRTVLLR